MHIGWPQGIYLALLLIGVGIHLIKDGEPKNERYSFGRTVLASAFAISLLWWGGFFS